MYFGRSVKGPLRDPESLKGAFTDYGNVAFVPSPPQITPAMP